jgi:hypothetical protein
MEITVKEKAAALGAQGIPVEELRVRNGHSKKKAEGETAAPPVVVAHSRVLDSILDKVVMVNFPKLFADIGEASVSGFDIL